MTRRRLRPLRSPDAWYDVDRVDDATFTIAEPRYWQRNRNHLLVGRDRALLFDTGSGRSDLASVVAELTDRPVTVLASHVHFDHIGAHDQFGHVAAADLPSVRARTSDGERFRSRPRETLALRPRRFRVDEWLPTESALDLGDRRLELIATPGHSRDGIALWDPGRRLLLTGDLLYDGPLAFGITPGSDLPTASRSLRTLADRCDPETILGGHYGPLPGRALGPAADAVEAPAAGGVAGRGRPIRRFEHGGIRVVLSRGQARGCAPAD